MDTTNYCPLCEHYASSAEKLNDENRTLRQRVEELEQMSGDLCEKCGWRFLRPDGCALCRAEAAEAKLARCVEALAECFHKKDCLCVAKALAAAKGGDK